MDPVLLRDLGCEVILADSVHGGSTQSSGADTQYLQQCISSGSSARAAAAAQTAAAQAAVAAAGPALVWAELQHLDIFDAGEAAAAWWQQHGEAPNAVLMLSFPPPPPSEVAEAALRRFGGRWVLFIGEWRGCTGSKAFFDRLEAEWRLLGTFEVPRWPMMEDKAYFLARSEDRPVPHDPERSRSPHRQMLRENSAEV
ncbi:Palmitoyltransferase [Durusdinium trenchii]|uniref:Palmitoyltransferase n=1 Tax=Durusdinium trenchii TaxID=1381693 RepID=A0ABP0I9X2_9DINO